ncbi:Oidioi.mRNA.OKI2018_I69.PAR.g9908.t1.cds [Oikopleura dioica]|uniref:Oidioi.mRNA.OKI2018_I69.PAR.g9908.t1.cds n=1 Tax=Oikopleura dioica TaxID=34765 RepID=A0ABN7RTP6_OIKDI|nr:Oidioi.mRNA.OKI2018_I69.PAR.g9908.t1.cds [Oikopleura dioica]
MCHTAQRLKMLLITWKPVSILNATRNIENGSNTKKYIAHQSRCEDEICTLCVPMKEKYYDLAYKAAREKARDMLNKLRRKEQLDKIYNKFESATDAIVPTDFNYQGNYAATE